jgi:hypothetical protein
MDLGGYQAGPGGPAMSSLVLRIPFDTVKGHCGTPLRSVSSFALSATLDASGGSRLMLENCQASRAIRARSTGK